MIVARLRANGSNDPDFWDGRQQVDFGSFDAAFGVAMLKVLLAGIQKRRAPWRA